MSVQDKVNHHLGQLDKELSKYQVLNDVEKQTSVPKVYMVVGVALVYFFFIFFNIGGEFLVNIAGFIIPGWYSMAALFSTTKSDDTQWLTYWVVYAFLTVFESAVSAVYWFPFYYTFKFVLLLWMSLPQFGGAQVVFRQLLQPLFGRFFNQGQGTAANLRAQADKAL